MLPGPRCWRICWAGWPGAFPGGRPGSAAGRWCAGCLLLTHAATLFTVFEPDVHAAGLRDPGRLVTSLIRRELAREGLPEDTFGRLDPDEVVLARIADRSVLGCMNDMAFLCEVAVDRSAGLADTDIGTSTGRCGATSTGPAATSRRPSWPPARPR